MQFQSEALFTTGFGPLLAWHPNQQYWASATPQLLFLWNGATIEESLPWYGFPGGDLAFHQTRPWVLASPTIYDLQHHAWLPALYTPQHAITQIPLGNNARADQFEVSGSAWSPDATILAIAVSYRPPRRIGAPANYRGPHHRLLLLDRDQGQEQVLWEGNQADQHRPLAVGDRLIAAGRRSIGVWDRAGHSVGVLEGHAKHVRALRFDTDGQRLISADWSGVVIIWDLATAQPLMRWQAHRDSATVVQFHPLDRNLVITGGDDQRVVLWQLRDDQPAPLATISCAGGVAGLALSPDGQQLLLASAGQIIRARLHG
ncbi:MAG: hypothetical protein Fur005_16110 [Roseiflexaceae bacterium]